MTTSYLTYTVLKGQVGNMLKAKMLQRILSGEWCENNLLFLWHSDSEFVYSHVDIK